MSGEGGGGGRGESYRRFLKEKLQNVDYFHASKVIEITCLTKKYFLRNIDVNFYFMISGNFHCYSLISGNFVLNK